MLVDGLFWFFGLGNKEEEEERGGRQWAEMGGLLSLACLAICPGVKVCTHRGCSPLSSPSALARGVPPPGWQKAEAPGNSEFVLGVAATPTPSPSPPHSSTHCLICHCQIHLRYGVGVGVAARVVLVWCK